MEITTFGLDRAKNVFQVRRISSKSEVVLPSAKTGASGAVLQEAGALPDGPGGWRGR